MSTKDKYILGYIYGLCDYTNDLHGLDNEIAGIGTFMTMHTFFLKLLIQVNWDLLWGQLGN